MIIDSHQHFWNYNPERDSWIDDMSAQGLPAQDLYDLVQTTLAASK